MNTKKILMLCAWLLAISLTQAQVPQLISYQAVARDLTGKVLSEKPISVQVEILQGSNQGTAVYTETHELTTTKTGTIKGDGNAIENIFLTEEPGTNGSYTNLPVHRNITVTGCTNKHRLSWRASFRVDGQGLSTITAGDTYVYIDNIRVSIK